MRMRLLVVMNPSARDFRAERRWPKMERLLRGAAEITLLLTEPDDRATLERLRTELRRGGHERVLAIGGDGTIHLVVNALFSADLKDLPEFAVIPFGTANDVARSLRLPLRDLDRLTQIAIGHHLESLDVSRVRLRAQDWEEERIWLNCVGIGMDADVVAARQQWRPHLKGYASYAAALLERSLEQRNLDVHLVVDGQAIEARVFNLVITNVPVYAGELRFPGSSSDGLLDVHLLDRLEYGSKFISYAIRKADILKLGFGEMIDALTDNQRTLHGRSVRLRLAWPRCVQVDGEALPPASDIDCDVIGRLWVAVP